MNANEIWQVEVNGQIYEADFEELGQWIAEGALLPADKIRRGNLRWLEAGKVPLLHTFFNAKELGLPMPVVPTFNDASPTGEIPEIKTESFSTSKTFSQNGFADQNEEIGSNFQTKTPNHIAAPLPITNPPSNACLFHPEEEPKFVCQECANLFCKACPKSYGGTVKICPVCDSMCNSIADVKAKNKKNFQYQNAVSEGFGFADFGNALAYPFRFKTSLIFGAILFMFFTLGQSASAVGGIVLFACSIICVMLANALTFGCLANTVENFSQGNLDADFMPSYENFSLWDDVVHPFFLSIGAYLVSFAPLVLVVVVSIFFLINSIKPAVETIENTPAQKIERGNLVIEQMNKHAAERNQQIADNPGDELSSNQAPALTEEEEFQKLEEMINQSRKSQLESVVGKSPETERQEKEQIIKQFLGFGVKVLVFAFLALLWGFFYFPIACAVAGYTRSFTAVINPLVGLDTIKRLGFTYIKILLMSFILIVFSGVVGMFLAVIFSPFDLPRMGNLPATAIGSFFTFYFSVVFSVILGYALYKCSDRLNLYRG